MKVKATASFGGAINMRLGEEREIGEGETLSDLLLAGYVIPVEPKNSEKTKEKTKK